MAPAPAAAATAAATAAAAAAATAAERLLSSWWEHTLPTVRLRSGGLERRAAHALRLGEAASHAVAGRCGRSQPCRQRGGQSYSVVAIGSRCPCGQTPGEGGACLMKPTSRLDCIVGTLLLLRTPLARSMDGSFCMLPRRSQRAFGTQALWGSGCDHPLFSFRTAVAVCALHHLSAGMGRGSKHIEHQIARAARCHSRVGVFWRRV